MTEATNIVHRPKVDYGESAPWAEQAFHTAISDQSGLRPDERPIKYFIRQCTNLCANCGFCEHFTEVTLLLQHPRARIIRHISHFEWNLPIEIVPSIHYEVPVCTFCDSHKTDLSHLPAPPVAEQGSAKTLQFPAAGQSPAEPGSAKKKGGEKKTYTITDLL